MSDYIGPAPTSPQRTNSMDKSGIVAFGFTCMPISPAECEISEKAGTLAQRYMAPVYTQVGVPIIAAGVAVSLIDQGENDPPPPTLRICRGAVAWATARQIDVLRVVCARPHRWRIKRDLQYAIREAGSDIKFRICNGDIWYWKWFYRGSTLWYTRCPLRWHLRDTILRLMPFRLYR